MLTIPKVVSIGLAGLGIGVGGGSLVFKSSFKDPFEIYKKTKYTIGQVSAEHTSDAQWMFLFKLADKVFKLWIYTIANTQLKDINSVLNKEFNILNHKDTEGSEDWEKFRDLCVGAIKDEDEIKGRVKKAESRLCFMGKPGIKNLIKQNDYSEDKLSNHISIQLEEAAAKGDLSKWKTMELANEKWGQTTNFNLRDKLHYIAQGFEKLEKNNYQLWDDFKSKQGKEFKDSIPYKEFEVKFEEWYGSALINYSEKLSDLLKVS